MILRPIVTRALLVSLALVGCSDGISPDPESEVTTITLSPDSVVTISVDAGTPFTVVVLDQFGDVMAGVAVAWSSTDEDVAQIDASGAITATGTGTTAIRATADGVSGEATLRVEAAPGSIVLTPDAATLGDLTDTLTFTAEVLDQFGNPLPDADVSWSSSEAGVAEIDSDGAVTPVAAGRTIVTASAGSTDASAELEIITATAFVSHRFSGGPNPLMVIDPATRLAVDTLDLPELAGEIAFGPGDTHLYVSTQPAQPGDLTVVDAATRTTTTVSDVGATPIYVEAAPDGSEVYVGNVGSQTLTVVETTTNTIVDSIQVAGLPRGLAVAPDGSEVWVALGDDCPGRIDVIDTATQTVVDSIFPGECTGGDLAFTPDGSRVYVADGRTNKAFVIDATARTVSEVIFGLASPRDVAISVDGTYAFFTNFSNNNSIGVVDTDTDTVVESVDVGSDAPRRIAVSPEGLYVYATIPAAGQVVVIDVERRTVVGYISVGQDAYDVAFTR